MRAPLVLLFLNDRAVLLSAGKRARLVKVTDVIGDIHARVLRYGTSRAFGRFTCTSRTTALTCRDTAELDALLRTLKRELGVEQTETRVVLKTAAVR